MLLNLAFVPVDRVFNYYLKILDYISENRVTGIEDFLIYFEKMFI
jgi:hypothetical protein